MNPTLPGQTQDDQNKQLVPSPTAPFAPPSDTQSHQPIDDLLSDDSASTTDGLLADDSASPVDDTAVAPEDHRSLVTGPASALTGTELSPFQQAETAPSSALTGAQGGNGSVFTDPTVPHEQTSLPSYSAPLPQNHLSQADFTDQDGPSKLTNTFQQDDLPTIELEQVKSAAKSGNDNDLKNSMQAENDNDGQNVLGKTEFGIPRGNSANATTNPVQTTTEPATATTNSPTNPAPTTTNFATAQIKVELKSLLAATFDQHASDLHITVGYPPMIRVDSKLAPIGAKLLTKEQAKELIYSALSTEQRELLEVNKEVDLAIDFEEKARFRVNAFTEKGVLSAAFRLIPSKIKTLEELNLPKKLHEFAKLEQGLVLVTGPTGHGKSTTLAALLQEINQKQDRHIITIEDPIEYVFPRARGLVRQRELHQDTHSWEVALRSVLREDPDVVMVGEMRDFETMAAAITVAETGHLVFATLHTNSASQSIDRIIDVFPPHQQGQIRVQLANVLEGVISQRLLPKIGGGRVAAVELMMATPAVRNLIREQKTYQIDNIISTSFDFGMQTIERALANLVSAGTVDIETAKRYSVRPEELDKLLNRTL